MIVVAALDGRFSVAVTVETATFSEIDDVDTAIVTSGGASSSVIVKVASGTLPTPWALPATPDTVTRLFGAWVVLFTVVIVTLPVLVVSPAAKVSVFVVDSVKSPATAGDTASADTVIVVAALDS